MPSSLSRSSSPSTASTGLGGVFDLEVVYEQPGIIIFTVAGSKNGDALKAFANEAGGIRVQRVPPTEKRGRVHSSTITVSVLDVPTATELVLDDSDLEWKTTTSGGAGGQHVNKTQSAVQLKHLPTGLMVRCEGERSQMQNRHTALELLRSKLQQGQTEAASIERNSQRKAQIGCGARGDKTRTLAFQRDQAVDHRSGKQTSVSRYLKGYLEDLQ